MRVCRSQFVVINFFNSIGHARDLRAELENAGGETSLLQGDVSDRHEARRIIRNSSRSAAASTSSSTTQPGEIAKAAAFLICDGDYITGQQININGGIYM
jgi:hypothetical protein